MNWLRWQSGFSQTKSNSSFLEIDGCGISTFLSVKFEAWTSIWERLQTWAVGLARYLMQFRNPQNDHVETVTTGLSWLWCFLWTPIYYAVKGIWTHAIASLVLAIVIGSFTAGIGSWLVFIVYAVMNKGIVRTAYLRKGWIEVWLHRGGSVCWWLSITYLLAIDHLVLKRAHAHAPLAVAPER